jgi:hypothetical protein
VKIIAWLKNRRRNRHRLLFRFWDGEQERSADPYRLWRDLNNHPKINLEEIAPAIDEGREPETTTLIEAMAEVFGLKRFDSTTKAGLTDWEVLNLLVELDEYLLALKKNINIGPISPAPTA